MKNKVMIRLRIAANFDERQGKKQNPHVHVRLRRHATLPRLACPLSLARGRVFCPLFCLPPKYETTRNLRHDIRTKCL